MRTLTLVRCRTRIAAVAVSTVVLAVGLAGTRGVDAATVGNYTATVTPSSVLPGSSTQFTVTFTNQSLPASALSARYFSVTVPQAFTITHVGASTPSWTESQSGQTVSLSDLVGLTPGSSLSLPISATAAGSALGSYTWTTQADTLNSPDPANLWTIQGSQPAVGVHGTAYSDVPCPGGHDCNSGKLSGSTSTVQVDSPATNSSTSDLQTEIGGLPKLQCTGHGDVFRFNVPNRTATVTYVIKGSFENGLGICWVSAEPFPTVNGSTATYNAADGGYEGLLPRCGGHTGTNPCVQSQSETEQPNEVGETLVTQIFTPIGDPVGSGH